MSKAFDKKSLKRLLESKVLKYNTPEFIPDDPICIPHQFSKKQDIEITGFLAATLAWGQRKTIINKCNELIQLMDNSPHAFILNHKEKDLKRFLNFRHRTFQPTDVLYFISFFKDYYSKHESLEDAFSQFMQPNDANTQKGLEGFNQLFFSLEHVPQRTRKHVSSPAKNSACKRLNMFLRWMVRNDKAGVDFGIWKSIKPSQLLCPLDVHVNRVARNFGLIQQKTTDWKAALELTNNLKQLDKNDPVKYDFALFGIGVTEKI
ncbi:MAG: TIGR02757 family protein [Chitinophagales bacterium]|nr:TIGR02757 family protein [Chitinophagales bacterium]